ncbi:MAG: hypothetical protein WD312_03875 [Candidatus Paceibacterota bacterium]
MAERDCDVLSSMSLKCCPGGRRPHDLRTGGRSTRPIRGIDDLEPDECDDSGARLIEQMLDQRDEREDEDD